jgi:D-glycero-alpha-D-manno-heptose-7-phosphate kinase
MLTFRTNGDVEVESLAAMKNSVDRIVDSLSLAPVGGQRKAATILSEQSKGMEDEEKRRLITKIVELVPETYLAIKTIDLGSLGASLHESWKLKKQLASNISSIELNNAIAKASHTAGFKGGKLLGAGGGGYFLKVNDKLEPGSQEVGSSDIRFKICWQGSKIV